MDKRLLRAVTSISVNDAWPKRAFARAAVCRSVCLRAYLPGWLSDCLSVCLSACLCYRCEDKDLIVRKVAEEAGFERTLRK